MQSPVEQEEHAQLSLIYATVTKVSTDSGDTIPLQVRHDRQKK